MGPRPVIKLLKPLKDKPSVGLTVRQILQASLEVNAASTPATISLMKAMPVKKIYGPQTTCKVGYKYKVKDIRSPRQPPVIHTSYVWAADPQYTGRLSDRNVKVMVSCDCEAFMYRSEYALHYYKASLIHFSNGQPPNVTNPGLIPFGCKHLEKILMQILRNGL